MFSWKLRRKIVFCLILLLLVIWIPNSQAVNAVSTYEYQYDSANRLTNVFKDSKLYWTYTYDRNGNLLEKYSAIYQIAGGVDHSIRLKADGSVWSTGANYSGQLGIGKYPNQIYKPVKISKLSNIEKIIAGSKHNLAIDTNGKVFVWGENYSGGQLGDGTTIDRNEPYELPDLSEVVTGAAGEEHSVVVKANGTVWSWGTNYDGRLGDGTDISKKIPVKVTGIAGVKSVAAGRRHTVALKYDGTLWSWGGNSAGELGTGDFREKLVPTQVLGISNVKEVVASSRHTVALKTDGTVWMWGNSPYGEHSYGINVPTQIQGLNNVSSIATGKNDTFALLENGTVWSWSYINDSNKKVKELTAPEQVLGVERISQISAGENFAFAISDNGMAWGWGENEIGCLGDGTRNNQLMPVKVY